MQPMIFCGRAGAVRARSFGLIPQDDFNNGTTIMIAKHDSEKEFQTWHLIRDIR